MLIGIALANSSFTLKEIASYEALLFVGSLLSFFWMNGIKNALLSDYRNHSIEDKQRLLWTVFFILLLFGLVAASIIYVCAPYIFSFLFKTPAPAECVLLAGYVFLGSIAVLAEILYTIHEESRSFLWYSSIIHGILLIGALISIYFWRDSMMLWYALLIYSLLRCIWLVRLIFKYGGTVKFSKELCAKFMFLAAPLILHMLLGNGIEYVDGIMVGKYFEEEQFAIFRYGARELPIISILVGSMVSAILPVGSTDLSQGLAMAKRRITSLSNYLFPLAALLMLCSPMLFRWVYNEAFVVSAFIFNVYLLTIASRVLLPQIVLYCTQKNHIILYATILELALNIALNFWMISQFGLIGIAYTTVIVYILQKLFMILYNSYVLKVALHKYLNVRRYAVYMAVLIIAFILSHTIYS